MQHEPRITLSYCKLAYLNQQELAERIKALGGRVLASLFDAETDTQGFVAIVGDEIIVSFRGTEVFNAQDWKTDLNRELIYCTMAGGKIHRGFSEAFESIAEQLEDAIHEAEPVSISVYGHSLGGAIAIQSAYHIRETLHRGVGHVGLVGCPKVGDALFAAQYNRSLFKVTQNYVNCCDIVPRVPFWNHSVGQSHYIDSDLTVHAPYTFRNKIASGSSGLFRFYDRVKGRFEHGWKIPSRGIADHYLSAYGKAM